MEKFIEHFIKLYTQLTLKLTLLWGLLMLFSLGGWIGYKHQDELYLRMFGPARQGAVLHIVSPPTGKLLADLQATVNSSDTLVAAQIVDVDLMRNTRNSVWFYSSNHYLTAEFEKYQRSKIGDTPWFSGSSEANARNVAIVQGAAACIPMAGTSLTKAFPEAGQFATTICAVPVPPEFGEFSGYLSFWYSVPLDPDQQVRAIDTMKNFSSRIK